MKIAIGCLPLKNINGIDVFLHPIGYKNSITYEPMAEEAVIALIAKHFCYANVPSDIKSYFDEMDDGYLFSESNFDEYDLEKLEVGEIIVGRDIKLHPNFDNIKSFLMILKKFGGFKIDIDTQIKLQEIDELDSFDGTVYYCCEDDKVVGGEEILCSKQFLIANRINSNKFDDKNIKLIDELKGTFGIIYKGIDSYPFIKKSRSL